MADRIYLSCWVRGFSAQNMLAAFEKVLKRFPFSRMQPMAILRVYAIEIAEPPQTEERFEDPLDPAEIIRRARLFESSDCAYQVETNWDLWAWDEDWKITPAPISISCFGPDFASDLGEQLRIEFGPDLRFLPQPGQGGSLTPVQSNIRSMLHLVQDLQKALPLEKKTLWSESGENLAERLQEALSEVDS